MTETGIKKQTDYLAGGFQYKNNALLFFPHAEGYVNVIDDKYNYVFNYTDHLGNIRVSYGVDPSTQTLKVLEENHYYPFGLKHEGYNMDYKMYQKIQSGAIAIRLAAPLQPNYLFKYNGKELQTELGLDLYDYGARNYDPSIGRWMNVDPLAENSRGWSPYTYVYNNPLLFIDPDGRDGVRVISKKNKTITIKAVYYVQTEKSQYLNSRGKVKYVDGYSSKDVAKMQTKSNKYLNGLKNNVVQDGEYKDYKIVYDLQFKEGGTREETKEKASNEKYEGVSIGNSIDISNSSETGYFKSQEKENSDGTTTVKTVGGATSKKKNILMNDGEDNFMNTIHEIFHTLGFSHPKGGSGQGIMNYPPKDISQQDTNQISEDEFLPAIERE